MHTANSARAAFPNALSDLDVVLTYSAPDAAPISLDSTGGARFNSLWTVLGAPCVNVPAHIAENDLPVGVQIITLFGDDAKALAAVRFLESALRR
ncbi:amidase [Bradyrhizobium huanghuaihaiense]|nr:amidase [Bradyrhizobium sp. CB3035]